MPTLSHSQIWSAIDALAARLGMTPSALARLAGLDPTSFNRSKRMSSDKQPRPRWPSTESLAKVLHATGLSLAEFAVLAEGDGAPPRHQMPILGFETAARHGCFDESGHPVGAAWNRAAFPDLAEDGAYALEITGKELEPNYHPGDTIIIGPARAVKPGDRVLVKVTSGALVAGRVLDLSQTQLSLARLDGRTPDRDLGLGDVVWVSRIVWVSQ
jgi:phage repressor protein C with HTH and peptisase S24 domain